VGLSTGTLEAKDYGYSFNNGSTNAIAGLGCDVRIANRAFVGLFGNYTFTNGTGELFGYNVGIAGRWDAGARIGYLVEESTAIFLKAGVAGIDVKNATEYTSYTIGGGIETYPFKSLPNTSVSFEASTFIPETELVYGESISFDSIEGSVRIKHRFLTY